MPNKRFPGVWDYLFARKEYSLRANNICAQTNIVCAQRNIVCAQRIFVCVQSLLFYCGQTKASDDIKSWHIEAAVFMSPDASEPSEYFRWRGISLGEGVRALEGEL